MKQVWNNSDLPILRLKLSHKKKAITQEIWNKQIFFPKISKEIFQKNKIVKYVYFYFIYFD